MGIAEVLTVIFIVLKLTGVISWSWWLVLLPEIVAIGLYLIWFVIATVFVGSVTRQINKSFKDWD